MTDRKVQPVWEWTFDRSRWPYVTFFGRRWVEFHDGIAVEPPNGCIYFWICSWATIAWAFSGAFAAIRFPIRILKAAFARQPKLRPEPVTETDRPVVTAPPQVAVKTYEDTKVRIERQTPLILRLIGRYVLHPVFLGRYSPFRMAGRGLVAMLHPVDRWFTEHQDDVQTLLISFYALWIIGILVTDIVFLFLEHPILMALIVAGLFGLIGLLTLVILFFRSEFGRVVVGMAVATKKHLCPGIRFVNGESEH